MGGLLPHPHLQSITNKAKHLRLPSSTWRHWAGWAEPTRGTPPHQVSAQGSLLVPVGPPPTMRQPTAWLGFESRFE